MDVFNKLLIVAAFCTCIVSCTNSSKNTHILPTTVIELPINFDIEKAKKDLAKLEDKLIALSYDKAIVFELETKFISGAQFLGMPSEQAARKLQELIDSGYERTMQSVRNDYIRGKCQESQPPTVYASAYAAYECKEVTEAEKKEIEEKISDQIKKNRKAYEDLKHTLKLAKEARR